MEDFWSYRKTTAGKHHTLLQHLTVSNTGKEIKGNYWHLNYICFYFHLKSENCYKEDSFSTKHNYTFHCRSWVN